MMEHDNKPCLAKEMSICQEPILNQSNLRDSKDISEHFVTYQKYFDRIKKRCQLKMPDFSRNGIKYDDSKQIPFSYKIINQLNNYEIVIIQVCIRTFTLNLEILNIAQNSPLERRPPTKEGSYGKIYAFSFLNRQIAVKSTSFPQIKLEKIKKTISRVIQQYCIAKICDALGCGPSAPNYFGFDLIIFNDCVQFAIEKCQILTSLKQSDYQLLLQNLGTLHRYKIVHMDINFNNIMVSNHFKKIVFIDFGFSEVIAQDCGYKTYTAFRGTPYFVSDQMLQLFLADSKCSCIDLYYNDLVCTLKTFDRLFQQAHNQIDCNEQITLFMQNEQHSRNELKNICKFQINSSQMSKQFVDQYLFLLFMHESYFNKQATLHILQAKDSALIKFLGKKVLLFIQKLVPSIFFQHLLSNQLKQLAYLEEYKNLKMFLKAQKQKEQFGRHILINKDEENSCRFRQIFQKIDFNSIGLEITQNKKQVIIKCLKNTQFFNLKSDKMTYFDLLLHSLRFDQNNLQIGIKKEIAEKFLEFIGQKNVQSSDTLSAIKKVFKYLLSYCMTESSTEWKKQNILNVFAQAILLDVDIMQQLEILEQTAASLLQSYVDIVKILSDYFMMKILFGLKHRWDNKDIGFNIRNKIWLGYQKIARKVFQMYQQEKSKPFLQSQRNNYLTNQQIMMAKIRFYQTHFNKFIQKNNCFRYKLAKEIKSLLFKGSMFQQRNFIQNFCWNYSLLKLGDNVQQFYKFSNKIRNVINCDIIYNKLILKYNELNLKDLKVNDSETLLQYCLQLAETCFTEGRYFEFSGQFHQIVYILATSRQIDQRNSDLIRIIATQYRDFTLKLNLDQYDKGYIFQQDKLVPTYSIDKLRENKYFLYLQRQGCYRLFLEEVVPFKQQVEQIENQFKANYWKTIAEYAKAGRFSHQQTTYCVLEYNKYFAYKEYINKQWSKAFYILKDLIQKLNQQIPNTCFDWTIRKIVKLINEWKSKQILKAKQTYNEVQFPFQLQQILQNILIWGWKLLFFSDAMEEYFQREQPNQFIINCTLQILWKNRKKYENKIYQFLNQIINVVSKQPFLDFTKKFILNIKLFKENNKQFFRFQHLQQKLQAFKEDNAYQLVLYAYALIQSSNQKETLKLLVFIAKNIYMLRYNIKQYILEFYYQKFLHSQRQFIKSKKVFLICLRSLNIYEITNQQLIKLMGDYVKNKLMKYNQRNHLFRLKLKEKLKLILNNSIK